jgi:O-antigen ligase
LWALALLTFKMPDTLSGVSDSMDPVAKLKLVLRLFCVGSLGGLLWMNWRHPRCRTVLRCFLPLALFTVWGIVSVLWSALAKVSLGQVSGLVVLLLLAINLAVLMQKQESTRILFHLSAALLTFSTVLLLVYHLYPGLVGFKRLEPTAVHPTSSGATASLGILLCLGVYLIWGANWSRVMLLPALLIHGYVLHLAHSRTAMILTISLAIAMYFGFRIRRALPLALAAGSTLMIGYLVADPALEISREFLNVSSQYVERGKPEDLRKFTGRTDMWNAMWKSYLESPLIGHGYFVTSRTGEIDVWYEKGNWTAHNIWLQALVTTGLVGALLFLWGLVRPLRAIRRCASSGVDCRQAASFVRVMVIWYFVWGLFASSFLGGVEAPSVVAFVVLGMGVGNVPITDRGAADHRLPDLHTSSTGLAGG